MGRSAVIYPGDLLEYATLWERRYYPAQRWLGQRVQKRCCMLQEAKEKGDRAGREKSRASQVLTALVSVA
jgi:hypothetical protein